MYVCEITDKIDICGLLFTTFLFLKIKNKNRKTKALGITNLDDSEVKLKFT